MRVHIEAGHTGFELKEQLVKHLEERGYEIEDHGAHGCDILNDYPPLCLEAAEAITTEPESLGVVIGGSGSGEQIAANHMKGVRAILVQNGSVTRLARKHNNANIVPISARQYSVEECFALVNAFLKTPLSQDERHQRHISLIDEYEETHRKWVFTACECM